MHLQFNIVFSEEICLNEINLIYIRNISRIVPNFNLGFKIKCKVSRKNLETKNKKTKNLCRVPNLQHSAKIICAECQTSGTRQKLTVCTTTNLCRVSCFAESLTLGKDHLRRGPGFAECLALGKEPLCREPGFAESGTRQRGSLPRAALGKEALCRVPDIQHSAKHLTLGKVRLSCSE